MNIDYPNLQNISGLRTLWKEAFGDGDEFLDAFFSAAFSPSRALCAVEDGHVVGALYWFMCECYGESVAYIYAVATLKSHRNRGICRRLMEKAHTILRDCGCACAVLVPGDKELFDFYGRLGYKTCTSIRKWDSKAQDSGVVVTEIDKAQFMQLRRQYLPQGGVVQENENIDFLSKQMKLYSGDGFVMAAYVCEDTLYCAELLGDAQKASGILYALGAQSGHFRTVGEDIPFSMYYKLKSDAPKPEYFGLAFD